MTTELQSRLRVYCYVKFDQYDEVEVPAFAVLSTNPESSVYAFTLQYLRDDQPESQSLILKTFQDDMYGKDRTLKERHALKNLHFRGYPVPRPLASETDADHIGMPFIIMEQVPGRLLGEVLKEAPPAQRPALITPFVQLLVDLHNMNLKALVDNLIVKDDYTLIKRELYNLKGLVDGHDALTSVLGWLTARRDTVPCKRPSINHRDFHPWNVLVGDNGQQTVIDWGWQISDRRYDLAWLITKLHREGLGDLNHLILEEYQRLDEVTVEQLDYFEVLANLRWLANVGREIQTNPALQNGSRAQMRTGLLPMATRSIHQIAEQTGLEMPSAENLLDEFTA